MFAVNHQAMQDPELLTLDIPLIDDLRKIIFEYARGLEGTLLHCMEHRMVNSLIALSDGKLVSGSWENTLRVWEDGECLRTLVGHTGSILCLKELPGSRFASGSSDHTVRVWNARECEHVLEGHALDVYTLAVFPSGKLSSGSGDYTIRLWDTAMCYKTRGQLEGRSEGRSESQCERVLTGHRKMVIALAVMLDGTLASGSHDGSVRVWEVATGRCVRVLGGHRNPVNTLAVLPNGDLTSGSIDGVVRMWRGDACMFASVRHMSTFQFVVLPNGLLLSGSLSHIRLWDPVKGECAAIYQRVTDGVVLLHDGTVASSRDLYNTNQLDVWDPASGETLLKLDGLSSGKTAAAVLPNGRLAASDFNGNICVWK